MNYLKNGFIKVNKSPIILLIKLLISNILLDILGILILVIDYADMLSNGHLGFRIEEYFFLLILIIQLIIIIIIFIKWLNEYYIFENNKLIYYSGVIFKSKQEFILNKIGCTKFEQSILGKIFNYGDIILYISNQSFELKGLHNPNEFILIIGKKDV